MGIGVGFVSVIFDFQFGVQGVLILQGKIAFQNICSLRSYFSFDGEIFVH